MAVFAWSDTHLGHRNILKYRPQFSTVAEHDEYILTTLSETIRKRDKIYLLGDNAFDLESFERLMSAIPEGTTVVYMGGNHDFERGTSYFREVANHPKVSDFGSGLMKLSSYKMWASHAPIHPDELWHKVNIHGHVHDQTIQDPRYINVSVDNVGRPVNLDIVRKHVNKQDGTLFSFHPLISL